MVRDRIFKVLPAAWLAAVLLAPAGASAEPRRFTIDPEHFHLGFAATHIGYADVLGLFLEGGGSFVYDEEARALSELRVTVDAASVFTNHAKRDGHLRSKDFLAAGAHPEITFVMTGAEPGSETAGTVTGDLTMRGQTHPVTLEVVLNKAGTYPYNDNYVLGISARTVIERSRWGMTYAVENGWVADAIPITIEIEAIRE
ncbi:YceI family protein [Geminicoccaceae bacterium 1502E]|nr:YceI family protein [Geminicoccaceae bacterium 1502E]